MGYSKSRSAFERVEPLLVAIVGDGTKVERLRVPTPNPSGLAYAVREGIAAIKFLNTEHKYHSLFDTYKLRIERDAIVFDPRTALTFSNPIAEIADSFGPLEIENVTSLIEVVGAAIKHKAPCITFPDASLSEQEIIRLGKWTSNNNYVITSQSPLTLMKNATGTDSSTQDDSNVSGER